MRKFVFIGILSSAALIFIGGLLTRPATSAVTVALPQFDPTKLNDTPTISLVDNKTIPVYSFALPTVDAVKKLLVADAAAHVTDTKLIDYSAYETGTGHKILTISPTRQVWLLTRTYSSAETYENNFGTYKGGKVVNVIDAQNGNVISEEVTYDRGAFQDHGRLNKSTESK
ncbi:MAG: hypothetical protein PUP93_17710 [Rhizonema sp. NSF051]|nr:hypothetical protein [Rhizonema sp. NSF051]